MPLGPNGEKLSIKIDWLNFTVPFAFLEPLSEFLKTWLGDFKERPHGIHSYKYSAVCEIGGMLAWSPDRKEAFCSLNGKAWDMIPITLKLSVLQDLSSKFGAKYSRVDCALDDYERIASMNEIHAAAEAHNFCNFLYTEVQRGRKGSEIVSDSRKFGKVGKAGSGKFLIIYDKKLESEGQIDSIRYEARFYKEYANLVVQNFVESDDEAEFIRKIGRAIGGVISFVDRADPAAHGHVDRMPFLPWWKIIVDEIGSARTIVSKVVPPLESWCEYAKKSVFPSLALARVVLQSQGEDFWAILFESLEEGEKKLNWRKQAVRDLGIDALQTFPAPASGRVPKTKPMLAAGISA